MLDPNNITNFNRTSEELLEFWLFGLFVRGKNADVQLRKLNEFTERMSASLHKNPLLDSIGIWQLDEIESVLRLIKSGQYKSLATAIMATVEKIKEDSDFLSKASVQALEEIPGVGPKTSRFFVLHSRSHVEVAVLDVHILRYMREVMDVKAPEQTPTGNKYSELERQFIEQAHKEVVDIARFDLELWRASREGHLEDWRNYYV